MSRRKNKSMKYTSKGKFLDDAVLAAHSSRYDALLHKEANRAWAKYCSLDATEKLSSTMFELALKHVRQDPNLDDVEDTWYSYEVERNHVGDFVGTATNHGIIADGAKYFMYDALSYEETVWFSTRFEAEAWAFWRAVLAHGTCETFISGARYHKPSHRWFAFINEFEGVAWHSHNPKEE